MNCIYCNTETVPHPVNPGVCGCPKCLTPFKIVDGKLVELGSHINVAELVQRDIHQGRRVLVQMEQE